MSRLCGGLLVSALSFLVGFALVTSSGSTAMAIGAAVLVCLALAGSVSVDLRRSDTALARLGLLVALLAAAAFLALPRIPMPVWAAAALGTFLTTWAFCLVGLMIWAHASGRDRRRWTAWGYW
jgi:hypothetical protein